MKIKTAIAAIAATAPMLALGVPTIAHATTNPSASDGAYHASPTGTGTLCTTASPCSLATALTHSGTIKLAGGTYYETKPIQLTSANNNSTITYEGNGTPIIDGSQTVTGWTAQSNGVYRASIPKGTVARQLYINSVAANMAKKSASAVFGTMSINSTGYNVTKNATYLSKSAYLEWSGPGTSNNTLSPWELWVDRYSPIQSITATSVTLPTEAVKDGNLGGTQGIGTPSQVVNDPSFIANPGDFAIDAVNGYIYYKPRSGENMSTVKATIPVSQGLLQATNVTNLTLSHITFTESAWQTPNNGADAFMDTQATVFNDSTAGADNMPGGAVQFTNSHHITVNAINVNRTMGDGIRFAGVGSNNVIEGSVVDQIGASGIVMGNTDNTNTDDQNNTIKKNTITNVGTKYHGGVGIMVTYARNTYVTYNTINHSNYSGISFGWGWSAPSNMGGNHINDNKILNTMQSDLQDGGAIYVNGTTDSTDRSSIHCNYIDGMPVANANAIYFDGSSDYWDATFNVVDIQAGNWYALQTVSGQVAKYNTVNDNFSNTSTHSDQLGANNAPDPTNTKVNNVVYQTPEKYNKTSEEVVAHAGA